MATCSIEIKVNKKTLTLKTLKEIKERGAPLSPYLINLIILSYLTGDGAVYRVKGEPEEVKKALEEAIEKAREKLAEVSIRERKARGKRDAQEKVPA